MSTVIVSTPEEMSAIIRYEIRKALEEQLPNIREGQGSGSGASYAERKKPLKSVRAICQWLGVSQSSYYKMMQDKRFSSVIHQRGRIVHAYPDDLSQALRLMGR